MVYRETFCKSRCVIISTLSSRIESMEFIDRGAPSFIHSGKEWEARTRSRSEMPVWTVSQKKSVIFSGGDSSKDYGTDQQRLQISDLHFDKFPTPATFACWKMRIKTEVCTCSQFPTEAMQCISGWIVIFVIYSWYFNAEFWSTRCENCFSTEQNHP